MGDLLVGGGLVGAAESQQRLEGRHRGGAAVVTEDELVEVDRQVLARDIAEFSGAQHPYSRRRHERK